MDMWAASKSMHPYVYGSTIYNSPSSSKWELRGIILTFKMAQRYFGGCAIAIRTVAMQDEPDGS